MQVIGVSKIQQVFVDALVAQYKSYEHGTFDCLKRLIRLFINYLKNSKLITSSRKMCSCAQGGRMFPNPFIVGGCLLNFVL